MKYGCEAKTNAEGWRNRDSLRTAWLCRTSGAVLSIWGRSSPRTCFLGWTPAGRRRELENRRKGRNWTKDYLIRVCWSNPYRSEETLMCFKSIFSCIQYVMLKRTASKHETDYSSDQTKGIWKRPKACMRFLDLWTSPEVPPSALTAGLLCLETFFIKHAV